MEPLTCFFYGTNWQGYWSRYVFKAQIDKEIDEVSDAELNKAKYLHPSHGLLEDKSHVPEDAVALIDKLSEKLNTSMLSCERRSNQETTVLTVAQMLTIIFLSMIDLKRFGEKILVLSTFIM